MAGNMKEAIRLGDWKEPDMPDQNLIETLRGTSLMLVALRKTIAASGHSDAMQARTCVPAR